MRHPVQGDPKKWLNRLWNMRRISGFANQRNRQSYISAASRYAAGFCQQTGLPFANWLPVPSTKSIGAIVTVMNEGNTLPGLLRQLSRIPLDEIIIIVNGSTDSSFQQARKLSGAVVVHYPQALGYDVGRAVGAKLSNSDILLFVDGDILIAAEDLLPFIHAIDKGMDVALNNITPYLKRFSGWDNVSIVKHFLNRTLGRGDLKANSLTAVPHALSKKALQVIGPKQLAVPPLAQAKAILSGLAIGSAQSVDVITTNRVRSHNIGNYNPVSEMIVGDHIEALRMVMEKEGPRIHAADNIRMRNDLVEDTS